jgi:hypothetical protein
MLVAMKIKVSVNIGFDSNWFRIDSIRIDSDWFLK